MISNKRKGKGKRERHVLGVFPGNLIFHNKIEK